MRLSSHLTRINDESEGFAQGAFAVATSESCAVQPSTFRQELMELLPGKKCCKSELMLSQPLQILLRSRGCHNAEQTVAVAVAPAFSFFLRQPALALAL